MDKVTGQCPQTTTFLERRRAEAVSNRGPSAYQPNALAHRVPAFRNVQPELPLQRGPAGAGRSKTSKQVNYTDWRQISVLHLLQIVMAGTEKFSLVLSCKSLHIWFLVHLVINIFFFDFGRLQENLHFLQKRQENTVTWCILVILTMLLSISCVIWWTIIV